MGWKGMLMVVWLEAQYVTKAKLKVAAIPLPLRLACLDHSHEALHLVLVWGFVL